MRPNEPMTPPLALSAPPPLCGVCVPPVTSVTLCDTLCVSGLVFGSSSRNVGYPPHRYAPNFESYVQADDFGPPSVGSSHASGPATTSATHSLVGSPLRPPPASSVLSTVSNSSAGHATTTLDHGTQLLGQQHYPPASNPAEQQQQRHQQLSSQPFHQHNLVDDVAMHDPTAERSQQRHHLQQHQHQQILPSMPSAFSFTNMPFGEANRSALRHQQQQHLLNHAESATQSKEGHGSGGSSVSSAEYSNNHCPPETSSVRMVTATTPDELEVLTDFLSNADTNNNWFNQAP
ncbi:hypothetical protein ZHAS_00005259 [Anopheles sinensis]|uniref:Uncharacterized protein n=1 Tax=Anopheles sinensis TaxID=74873 RepID=A0A084VIZ1_ANOSI|nr:hypothetical protein ZHAS_00005259 [Anopheles sinensis]